MHKCVLVGYSRHKKKTTFIGGMELVSLRCNRDFTSASSYGLGWYKYAIATQWYQFHTTDAWWFSLIINVFAWKIPSHHLKRWLFIVKWTVSNEYSPMIRWENVFANVVWITTAISLTFLSLKLCCTENALFNSSDLLSPIYCDLAIMNISGNSLDKSNRANVPRTLPVTFYVQWKRRTLGQTPTASTCKIYGLRTIHNS